MMNSFKLLRITTVPLSLRVLLKGQLSYMKQYFNVVAVSSGPDTALQQISEDEGVAVRELAMTRTISPLKDIIALWRFYQLCKKEKPTIVHSHTPKAGIVGMLGAKLAGVPIRLHTVAGLPLMEATGLKRKVLDFVERLTYASATKVYPNSKVLYDFIIANNYVSEDKLKVIANGSSNGIDTAFFAPDQVSESNQMILKKELEILPDDFVFVFVGRLVGDKGINELVEAFSKLQISKVKLLLVGPLETALDPLKSSTLDAISQHPNIISVGFQQDVRPYFAISDCLTFPSYREGFPNVVMQAGAMGLPSIVTNINGCNEIIQEEVNGLIIPVKDSEALQSAMSRILEDKLLYNNLKRLSRDMIISRYEQKVVWEAILAEYEALTG